MIGPGDVQIPPELLGQEPDQSTAPMMVPGGGAPQGGGGGSNWLPLVSQALMAALMGFASSRTDPRITQAAVGQMLQQRRLKEAMAQRQMEQTESNRRFGALMDYRQRSEKNAQARHEAALAQRKALFEQREARLSQKGKGGGGGDQRWIRRKMLESYANSAAFERAGKPKEAAAQRAMGDTYKSMLIGGGSSKSSGDQKGGNWVKRQAPDGSIYYEQQ